MLRDPILVVVALLFASESTAQLYYTVASSGASGYKFNGSAVNPTIVLTKGLTYGADEYKGTSITGVRLVLVNDEANTWYCTESTSLPISSFNS